MKCVNKIRDGLNLDSVTLRLNRNLRLGANEIATLRTLEEMI